MALAERPGTEGEGIAARTQAERLAQKHGINLDSFITPQPPKPQAPPPDPFASVLARFGWRREFNPFQKGRTYCHSHPDLAGHYIEVLPTGNWNHTIHGNMSYGGNSANDLLKHLNFNVN